MWQFVRIIHCKYIITLASILIVAISANAQIELVSRFDPSDAITSIYVKDNYVYLCVYRRALEIVDVTDPANPIQASRIPLYGRADDIVVGGSFAYLGCYGAGLQIVDISDPYNPSLVGQYYHEAYCHGLSLSGDYIYGAFCNYFDIINVSDPHNPTLADSLHVPMTEFTSSFLNGQYAYLPDFIYQQLFTFNIADPGNISITDTLSMSGRYLGDLIIQGNYAYAAAFANGIYILDISDPASPELIRTYGYGNIWNLTFEGNLLLATIENFGLRLINIEDPSHPRMGAFYRFTPISGGLIVSGNYIFASGVYQNHTQLFIFSYQTTGVNDDNGDIPSDFQIFQNYPNPFNAQTTISYSLPTASDVTIDIFDILGRKISILEQGNQQAGVHSMIWDAGDAASGIYFYRINANEYNETRQMMLLK